MNSLKNKIPISMRWKVSKEEIRKKLEQGRTMYKEVDIKEFPGIQYALVIEQIERNRIIVSFAFLMEKETKIKAKFKISLICTKNFTCNAERIFEVSEERWGEYMCSYNEFFDPLNNYFFDDYIYVTMEAIVRFENEPKVSINSEIKSSKNLGELFYNQNDDKDFDICFENGKCIKVHKLIISAKSPIFERMIQSCGFKESKENKVLIKDFDFEIVEAAIKYCYGFSIFDSLNISIGIKLLQFSDKYFIDDLKNSMESYLFNQISPTNVSEISNASIISNSIKLHKKCLDFMYIYKNV